MSDRIQISLKAARINAGFTLGEAAETMGIDVETLVAWEADPGLVNPIWSQVISRTYRIGIDHIYFGSHPTQ